MNYKNYCENIDGAAWSQFMEAMKQDFVTKGALMPDAHLGYSLPIGAVVACKDYVVPAYVGFDIGCGMSALKLDGVSLGDIKKHKDGIFDIIYKKIPVGTGRHPKPAILPSTLLSMQHTKVVDDLLDLGASQLGTLGGGNHFMEIGVDEEGSIWVIIHSGSRGFGHKIASHYMKLASVNIEKLTEEFDKCNSDLLKYNPDRYPILRDRFIEKGMRKATAKEGHFGFPAISKHGKDYLKDALFAQEFALENRKEMIHQIRNIISNLTGKPISQTTELINRNHNHVIKREVDGHEHFIHRKGATHAEEGMLGVIPGNMRDGCFIVMGKGNPESLFSSSHGAGRVLGRKQAKAQLNMDTFKEQMVGVKAKVIEGTLDESPSAYKNIFEVMSAQSDLVDIVAYVKPLINIKG